MPDATLESEDPRDGWVSQTGGMRAVLGGRANIRTTQHHSHWKGDSINDYRRGSRGTFNATRGTPIKKNSILATNDTGRTKRMKAEMRARIVKEVQVARTKQNHAEVMGELMSLGDTEEDFTGTMWE
jgi:hypothetical protein